MIWDRLDALGQAVSKDGSVEIVLQKKVLSEAKESWAVYVMHTAKDLPAGERRQAKTTVSWHCGGPLEEVAAVVETKLLATARELFEKTTAASKALASLLPGETQVSKGTEE